MEWQRVGYDRATEQQQRTPGANTPEGKLFLFCLSSLVLRIKEEALPMWGQEPVICVCVLGVENGDFFLPLREAEHFFSLLPLQLGFLWYLLLSAQKGATDTQG